MIKENMLQHEECSCLEHVARRKASNGSTKHAYSTYILVNNGVGASKHGCHS